MAILKPYRRPDRGGWYVDLGTIKLSDGSKQRFQSVKAEGRTKTEAKQWAEAERWRIATEGPRKRRKEGIPTLNDLLEPYLEESAKFRGVRPGSIERDRSAWRTWIAGGIGNLPVTDITTKILKALGLKMADAGRAPRTIRNTFGAVRGVLKYAEEQGDIEVIPKFPRLKIEDPEPVSHSYENAVHLLKVAKEWNDPASYPVIAIGLHTGMRAGEIAGLQWGDVDLVRGLVHVRRSVDSKGNVNDPKTMPAGKRPIPMTPTVHAVLSRWRQRAPVGVQWVFSSDGIPVTHKWLKWRVIGVLRRAALYEKKPLHSLRKTFNTLGEEREIPETARWRWMGHKPLSGNVNARSYTGRYSIEKERAWIARLEQPITDEPVAYAWPNRAQEGGSD